MTLRLIATLAAALAAVALVPAAGFAVDAGKVSVARGAQVAITGGCHDCHTAGYNESNGMIDPNTALKGIAVGWQGPWGTTYAKNIRLIAQPMTEDQWVTYAKSFTAMPPMPFYNVRAMDETDLRSLYQYIKSLGAPGDAVPAYLPPGMKPKTPFTVAAPPTLPTP